jgi:Fe-S-cluster containining protein
VTDEDAELVNQQHARWNDPETQRGAEQRMARVRERLSALTPKLDQQERSMLRAPHFKRRLLWLRDLTATAVGAVAPEAACRAGCSHCCYQPVMLTQAEAEVIARESGARLAQPAQWRSKPASQFTGQPCPFLRDARCSIYAHRPMACRLLFNMDRDALQCRIVPGAPATVPYANLQQMQLKLLQIHDDRETAASFRMADLREFFPKGAK